jgi:hypothetical protein
MAYEEPGVKVIQQLTLAAANIADATQAVTLVGELFELFDQASAGKYDAVSGAGTQSFSWPGKAATSIVDLAGVRKATAEPDSQLQEFAEYPLLFQLRDPVTGQIFDIDEISDVFSVDQSNFSVVQAASAATARVAGSTGTASRDGRLHIRLGGVVNAGVSVGDRIRVTNSPGTPTFDLRGDVTGFADDDITFQADGTAFKLNALTNAGATSIVATVTDASVTLPSSGTLRLDSGDNTELVSYSGVVAAGLVHTFTLVDATRVNHAANVDVQLLIRDTANVTVNDGVISALSGHVQSASMPFTPGDVGDRIVIWPEALQDNTGSVTGAGFKIDTGGLVLTSADVGKLATIWTDVGQLTAADGNLDLVAGQLSSAAGVFLATDLGKVIKIGTEYRRITAVNALSGPGVVTYSGTPLAGTGVTFIVYRDQRVRTITAVDVAGGGSDFWVDTAVTAGTGGLPVVIHRPEYRDVTSFSSSTDVVYSGSAINPDVGVGRHTPIRVFDERVTYEVMPDFDLLVSYRALNVSSVNDTLVVRKASDIAALGTVHKANTLLWAAQSALVAMGTEDTPVLLQTVKTFADGDETGFPEDKSEAAGYLAALEVLSATETPYFLVPLTRNAVVRDAFVSHVLAQSQPESKKERVCFLSYAMPMGDVESTTGLIAPGLTGGNKVISDPGRDFVSTHGLIPGNKVVITSPALYAGEYTIASGTDDDNLVLEGNNWRQDGAGAYLAEAKEFTVSDVSVGGQSGTGASFSAPVLGVVTVTGLTGMGAADVGRDLVVSAAGNGANVGSWPIVEFVGATSVKISHPAGVVDAASIAWSVTADNTARSVTADAWKDVEVGDYLLLGTQTRLITAVASGPGGVYTKVTYSGSSFSGNSGQTLSVLRTSPGVSFYANPLDKDEQASALAAISQSRGSRRVVHMWPDLVEQVTGTDSQGNEVREFVSSIFSAAAEAGRDSVLPPERSSTGSALGGFTGLKNSNKYFSISQLNVIAGGGWSILEQKEAGAPVKMRHLLTTDMSAVKNQELSFTKNVDNMAKVKRASTEPLLNDDNGRVNISVDLLTALAFPFQGIYEQFVRNNQLVRTAGKAPYKILSIRQDPLAPDCILEDVELNVPLPANRVVVTFII